MEKSDYNPKEFKIFEKYLNDHPDSKRWGMDYSGQTIWIPLHMIKEPHLVNIIKWIKIHPTSYRVSDLTMMEQEYARRQLLKTEAGQILYKDSQEGTSLDQ